MCDFYPNPFPWMDGTVICDRDDCKECKKMKKVLGMDVVVDARMSEGWVGIRDKEGMKSLIDENGNMVDLKEYKDKKREDELIARLRRAGFID